jgi:hypothetical protein
MGEGRQAVRLCVRVFIEGKLHSEEYVLITTRNRSSVMEEMGQQHVRTLQGKRGMIEFEFLGETNPKQRFFRIGTDPSGMVTPLKVKLKR